MTWRSWICERLYTPFSSHDYFGICFSPPPCPWVEDGNGAWYQKAALFPLLNRKAGSHPREVEKNAQAAKITPHINQGKASSTVKLSHQNIDASTICMTPYKCNNHSNNHSNNSNHSIQVQQLPHACTQLQFLILVAGETTLIVNSSTHRSANTHTHTHTHRNTMASTVRLQTCTHTHIHTHTHKHTHNHTHRPYKQGDFQHQQAVTTAAPAATPAAATAPAPAVAAADHAQGTAVTASSCRSKQAPAVAAADHAQGPPGKQVPSPPPGVAPAAAT